MATRSIDMTTMPFRERYLPATRLAIDEFRSSIESSPTGRYRFHGSDSLTIGDQLQWLWSIIVNDAVKIPEEWLSQETEEVAAWAQANSAVTEMVIERFEAIPEIQHIFAQKGEQGTTYFLFLNNSHYDRELMFRFFDIELEISAQFPNRYDSFRYLPIAMGADPDKDIPETAAQIFTRG